MSEPRQKTSGALSDESFEALVRHSRKFGFYASREHVWHLIDTVRRERERTRDALQLAADRGVKMVAFRDELLEVRGRVRTLLEAADRVLITDIPSTRERLEEAAEDLRSFAWPEGNEYRRRVEAESATGGGPVWVNGLPPPDRGSGSAQDQDDNHDYENENE